MTKLPGRRAAPTTDAARAPHEAALASYVDSRVVRHILSGGTTRLPSGVRRVATCLFADIRGFTRFVVREEPARVVGLLDRYFAWVCAIAIEHGGTIDKLIGDAVMVLFGLPNGRGDARAPALAAAVAMLEDFDATVEQPRRQSGRRLGLGVGIATGPVVLANVGSTARMDYTVVGPAVNLAARLCAEADHREVLCDAATWPAAEARRLGVVGTGRSLRLKGIPGMVRVRSVSVAVRAREQLILEDVDPICGMKVAGTSPHVVRSGGRTYRFCSRGCRTRFVRRSR